MSAELEACGPISVGNEALLSNLVGITVELERMNRAARRGEQIDAEDLLKVSGQQSRLLRMLRLADPLVPRERMRRISPASTAFENGGDGVGEMGQYIEAQCRKRERLATKMGFDPVLFDDHAGGRLNQFELCELLERGNECGARKLIRTAHAEYDEAQRLTAIDAESDYDYENKHQQRRKERCWVERKDRLHRATMVANETKKHRDR